ncbi:type II toxin-antitoxin system ParD family antitoxin [Neorhizobium galegae]|uniref:Type II toxin-antitoxin system ParD family antitoxin n=1 Tax=Neorhizobium galegae TaxID=399 RepID=A0A6A1TNQ4_NEOGA|nr:type II toxin-antitoxin system ParD family antitoxin [Neorhizobium galegae]KAB1085394.1 type II toxin-antitoxin system ParD family antitoxin [Neorhizobium galegae]
MGGAVKITVTLEPDIQDFVRNEVERGSFASTSEYIETVLRQRQERERARQQLDAELQKGLDDVRAGRVVPIDEAFAEVRRRLGITKSGR